jgi:D-threonate/D-erythronate kinase
MADRRDLVIRDGPALDQASAPGPTARRPVRVLADDLTGAADSGVAFLGGAEVVITLARPLAACPADTWPPEDDAVTVVDTDTREASPDRAYAIAYRLAERIGGQDHVLKKIDSLLRGQVAAELMALRRAQPERLIIAAPAVPAQGRITRGGAMVAAPDGGPARTILQSAQVAARLGDGPVRAIELRLVRAGTYRLARALHAAGAAGATVVCDALTDADLDRIALAGMSLHRPVLWAGAAGLAAALARSLRASAIPARPRLVPGSGSGPARGPGLVPPPSDATPLLIVGSYNPAAQAQVRALAAQGARHVSFDVGHLVAMSALERMAHAVALGRRTLGVATVVCVTGPVNPSGSQSVAAALGDICATAVAAARLVIICGGATARAALAPAGVTALRLLGEVEPGTVLARAIGPRHQPYVITRAGSFGDEAALVRLVTRSRAASTPAREDTG